MSKFRVKSRVLGLLSALVFAAVFVFNFGKADAEEAENRIQIVYATDDNYVYPTIVSITSLCENANPDTFYEIHMMVPGNIAAENKLKFSKLDQKYSNCTIDLIDMDDKFADCPVTHWPSVIYYKLSMPSILRDVDKCIYIDGDTIVKHDLSDMYYVDMKDYYVAGVNPEPYVVDEYFGCEYGSDGFQRVCDGILVWNLKKAREDDLETKFQELVESNNKEKKFMFGSEDIICITCKEKILSLPHKYGLFSSAEYIYWPWWDFEDWYDAQNDPVIVHYVDINKPWNGLSMGCGKLWWDYAKKTDIYGEIKAKYAGNLNDIAKYIYDI